MYLKKRISFLETSIVRNVDCDVSKVNYSSCCLWTPQPYISRRHGGVEAKSLHGEESLACCCFVCTYSQGISLLGKMLSQLPCRIHDAQIIGFNSLLKPWNRPLSFIWTFWKTFIHYLCSESSDNRNSLFWQMSVSAQRIILCTWIILAHHHQEWEWSPGSLVYHFCSSEGVFVWYWDYFSIECWPFIPIPQWTSTMSGSFFLIFKFQNLLPV